MPFDPNRFLGHRFNRLTVTGFTTSKYGSTVCVCTCECGAETIVSPHDLKQGRVKSCGCLNDEVRAARNAASQRKRAAEFIGKRFARLVVKEVVKREGYRRSVCVCLCDCGQEKDVFYSDLTSGRVKSCGCLRDTLRDLTEEERLAHQRELGRNNTRKYRETHVAAVTRWCEAHPEKMREYQLISRCRKFGITAEQYIQTLEQQGGGCAVCGGNNDGKRMLAIDHDHDHCSGAFGCQECFRGLLCDVCNRGIGAFNDDIARMQSAIDYLSKWKSEPRP